MKYHVFADPFTTVHPMIMLLRVELPSSEGMWLQGAMLLQ